MGMIKLNAENKKVVTDNKKEGTNRTLIWKVKFEVKPIKNSSLSFR